MTEAQEEREGVVRYRLEFEKGAAPAIEAVAALDAWRHVLFRLGLIGGNDPQRYHGLGFGNVSRRLPGAGLQFVISGTQTGHLEHAGRQNYCTVSHCDPAANRVVASGPVQPSSEALTHGAVYSADATVGCVLHAHNPLIWQQATALGLPQTPAEIPYGTPEMAAAVATLCQQYPGEVFVMAGHEDGVIAYGRDEAGAGQRMVTTLARALALRPNPES